MPWVRLDDRFPGHRKVRGLSDSAFRLHVEALCWSAQHLLDGHVPASDLLALATARRPLKFAAELVTRGSWHLADETCDSEKCPAHVDNRGTPVDDGWIIHDYFEYQQSRAKVTKERKAKSERQARWLEKKRHRRDASIDASKDAAPSPPRPEGSGGTGSPRASGAPGRTGPRGPAVRAVPPWCGQCDERTRMAGHPDHPRRCPTCHPLREEGL